MFFLPLPQTMAGGFRLDGIFMAFIVCFGLVVAWLVAHAGPLDTVWRRAPFNRLWIAVGEMSYSLYLLHALCISVVFYGFRGWLNDSLIGLLLTSLALSGAVSWLSYRWVEQPFLRRRQSGSGQVQA